MSKIHTSSPVRKTSKAIAASALSAALVLGMSPTVALAAVADGSADGVTVTSVSDLAGDVTADMEGATSFEFSDSGITVAEGDYTGYTVEGTDLTIKKSGTYVVSGECADGTITVKKGTTDVVLVLDGLVLTSSDTAPICCNKSSQVTILAADGTTNTLTDSAQNNDDLYTQAEDAAHDIENAVIKCKDGSQVTIGGTGTLNVVANGKNGIKSGATTESEGEAWLNIQDLNLNITASVNDAINAEATLNVASGNLTISAVDDAIHSDYVLNIGETGTDGPTIKVTSCTEGLEGATLTMDSGNVSITASDDGLNAANSDLTDYSFEMVVNGGTLYVNAAGDGLDSNGDLTINGGNVMVYAATQQDNSPLDADGTISINGGTVLGVGYPGMSEGISGTQSTIIFGSTGNAGGQSGDQPGQSGNQPGQPGQSGQIASADSTTTTDASLSGFQPGGNQPGGNQPGGNQPSGNQPGGQGGASLLSAGTAFTITDASGSVLTSGTAVRDASYVLFSSAGLTENVTYNLVANGSTVATATVGSTNPGGGDNPPTPPSGDQGGSDNPPTPPSGEPGDQGGSDNPPTPPSGEPGDQGDPSASTGTMVYRLYNSTTSEHLYTSDFSEVLNLSNLDWTYESNANWQTPTADTEGAVGVYRLYNSELGVHHYTTDETEVYVLTHEYGWTTDNNEAPLFYAYASDLDGMNEVYRLYNPNLSQHLLTEDYSEVSMLTAYYDWELEGVGFYLSAM